MTGRDLKDEDVLDQAKVKKAGACMLLFVGEQPWYYDIILADDWVHAGVPVP